MSDNPLDYELRGPGDQPDSPLPPPPKRRIAVWFVVIAALAAVGLAFWIQRGRPAETPSPTVETPAAVPAPPPARVGLGGQPFDIALPSLDESDAAVRTIVGRLSSDPLVATWLSGSNLIREFTLLVVNLAEGKTPTGTLRRFPLRRPFAVMPSGTELHIDPRTYQRYAPLAGAVASLDPVGASRAYATFKPLIEQAYREQGFPDTPFDQTLERVFVHLLGAPALTDPIRVEPKGIGYAFADPRVEALSPAQKLLIRSGATNAMRVKTALRDIALALGIPRERLPAS